MADVSLGRQAPGSEHCPPGYKPIPAYPGMPAGAKPCGPVGSAVPAGGYREARPGVGPGYAPTGARALEALQSIPGAAGDLLFGDGQSTDVNTVKNVAGEYADWIRGMAR